MSLEHGLHVVHAERAGRLVLALRDGLDARAEDLGEVGRGVDGHHDDAEEVVVDVDVEHRQAEEHDVDLEEERRAAQDVDVGHRHGADDPPPGDLEHREDQADRDGKRVGRNDDAQAQQPAGREGRKRGEQQLGLQEHAEELVGVPGLHPWLLVEPVDHRLQRRVRDRGDGVGRRELVRGTRGLVGSRDGALPARRGELHVGDLQAQERALGDRLVKAHRDGGARGDGLAGDVHALEPLEGGDARGGALEGRPLGKRQRDRGDLLARLDRALPGQTRVHPADDAIAAVLVGARGGLLGGERLRGLRYHGRKDARERQRERDEQSPPSVLHASSVSCRAKGTVTFTRCRCGDRGCRWCQTTSA